MELAEERMKMVEEQIISRGVTDSLVVTAMLTVPRHKFVPPEAYHLAYTDQALPIGLDQTISQPFIVALMASALGLGERNETKVLEVGSGSGYGAAVLSHIAGEVYSIERKSELLKIAEKRLKDLNYSNVHFVEGDGSKGLAKFAPFDGIVVTAAAKEVPQKLLEQLKDGARLVIPVNNIEGQSQQLLRITRHGDLFERQNLGDVLFVPLVLEEKD